MSGTKTILTEGYRKNKAGCVTLSGNMEGIDGIGRELLQELAGQVQPDKGDTKPADVHFAPLQDAAVQLVQRFLETEYIENKEGYVIDIDDVITVYADTERAKLYAAHYLRDAYTEGLQKSVVYNYPDSAHRSARVFLPPKKDMPYFKKFIDMLVYLGYNAILLEIGGTMEFKSHPEINETWAAYCQSMKEYNDKPYKASSGYYRTKNAVHCYNGGGDIYTQEEMKELVRYCAERYVEIIPEVPSLSHSEYFLISHPELRECDDEPYAAAACPSNPGLYSLIFDLYDEVIEVFKPKTIHIGHDEWFTMCICDKCKERNAAELFTENVLKNYNYLKVKGIRTMMWADKMVRFKDKAGEEHGGASKKVYHLSTGKTIEVMGKQYPLYDRQWFQPTKEAVEKGFCHVIHDTADCMHMLPEDIICVNWYWSMEPRIMDEYLLNGRNMIYGNFHMVGMEKYRERIAAGAQGFSVSNWLESTEEGMQRWNTLFDLGYSAAVCWGHTRSEKAVEKNIEDTMEALYQFRNGDTLKKTHIEIVHTTEKAYDKAERYYDAIPYLDETEVTMGCYEVQYEDGSREVWPVQYALNVGLREAYTGVKESERAWKYLVDKHLTTVATVCDIEKKSDGIWYKTVFPTKGNVVSCEYIPKKGMEGYVSVAEINIVNKSQS